MLLDRQTWNFWLAIHEGLAEHGLQILMLSSTEISDAPFPTLSIPYHLSGFAAQYPRRSAPALDQVFHAFANCVDSDPAPINEIYSGTALAAAYYRDVLTSFDPIGVIGWNGLSSHTRLFIGLARLFGIPAWCAERGWIRDTLMLDLGENSLLTEWALSTSLASVLQVEPDDESLYNRLRKHVLSLRQGKYPGKQAEGAADARRRLGIADDARVIAAFMHAEPGPRSPEWSIRSTGRSVGVDRLDRKLAEAACWARSRNAVLLIQDHPINTESGVTRPTALAGGARLVHENPYTLLELADVSLHAHSTLQFDAVFTGRPIVMMERSMLDTASPSAAYGLREFPSIGACLDAAFQQSDWARRHAALRRHITTLSKHQLIDLGHGIVPNAANGLVQLLARLGRKPQHNLGKLKEEFLRRWQEAPSD